VTTLLPGVGHPGTPLYMPPEQGNIATVLDVRSDLYALGVTLWEMQAGRDLKLLPALGETADLQAHHPQMSPGMAAVIWRATREDRDQRYESPQQMANELMAVRDGIWTPSRATIMLSRSARQPAMQSAAIERAPRRIRTVAALAALLTIAVLAAAILVIIPLSSKLGGMVTTSPAQSEPVGKPDQVISAKEQAEKVAPICFKQQLAFAQTPPIMVGAPPADILPSQDFVKGVTQLARWDAQPQVEHLAYAPDAQTFATALADGTVQLWPASGGKPLRTLCMPFTSDSSIVRVAFAADGSTIAAASGNGTLQIWDVRNGTLTRKADVPTKGSSVVNMAFAPNGRTLAVGLGEGATILIVRVVDGQVLSVIDQKSGGAETLTFAPDGQSLAVGMVDGGVQLWQVSDGALLLSSQTRSRGAPELAFAPDGRTLAVAGVDGSVQLLQISDGALLRTLDRPTQIPARATFAPDGQILAVAGWDGSVQLFQISDGALLRTLDGGPTKGRPNLAFAPDGKTLVATWEAGTISIWGLPAKPGA
jgi:WD40 repeat protein